MAEVTSLHVLNLLGDAEDRDSPIEFVTTTDHNEDPYWSSDFDFFISDLSPEIQPSHVLPRPQNSITRRPSLDFDHFDEEDEVVNPESVPDLPRRENQNNFVIHLLHQRVEQSQWSTEHVVLDREEDPGLDLNFGVIEGNEEMGSQLDHDIGLGFIEEPTSLTDERLDFVGESVDEERRLVTGLRLVEIGSDADSDFNLDGSTNFNADNVRLLLVDMGSESESDLNLDGINFRADDIQDASGDDNDDQSLGLCWDSFQIEDHRDVVNEEFDWEEVVEQGIDGIEELSTIYDAALMAAQEDRSSTVGNLEWQEVLVESQRMDGYHDTEDEELNGFSFDDHDLDEYNYATDYDMFFGHFGEIEIPILCRPPASKDAVKNLPVVVLSKDDVEKTNTICAVCRDEMEAGETVKQLSCCHKFHGDCIVPWLAIRNTCPVCRFELPTDDPEYEKRKDLRANQIQ